MSEQTDAYRKVIEDLIVNYSGANEQFDKIDSAATSPCDVNQIVNNMPNMTLVHDNGGNVIGYDYKYTGPNNVDTTNMEVDSNSGGASFGTATGGGGTTRGGGAGRYVGHFNNSTGFQAATDNDGNPLVSGFVDAAWGVVSTLAKFGKNVASAAADGIDTVAQLSKEAYDNLYVKSLENGADAIRALFGVDSNGSTKMYMDEDTIGALAILLRDDGYFVTSSGNTTASIDTETYPAAANVTQPFDVSTDLERGAFIATKNNNTYYDAAYLAIETHTDPVYTLILNEGQGTGRHMAVSKSPFSGKRQTLEYYADTGTVKRYRGYQNFSGNSAKVTALGTTYYYYFSTSTFGYVDASFNYGIPVYYTNITAMHVRDVVATIIIDGTIEVEEPIPGISTQDGSTNMVDAVTGADPHVVAQNLASQYPQVMGDPIQIVVLDDSCNEVTKNYYSVPISYSPTNINASVPITGGLQVNPSFNPDVQIDLPDIDMSKYTEQIINQLRGSGVGRDVVQINPDTGEPEVLNPTPPNTGDGVTPPEVMPETDVKAMWHVYNPSSSQLSSFGSWMWNQTIIDQIIRLFNNPMEAVIGLHAVYVEPNVSGSSSIVVGNLASSVSANIVNKQYKSLNCGSVWLTEYFGNVFDYAPYTRVKLYLPFIGIVDLNTADIMRGEITVQYMVDVYTGACTATVSVNRDGVGGVLYQYSGNCAVEYPVSGASYSRMWQALASTVAVGLGGAVTGNIAGAAGNMVATAMSAKVDVAHSGSFSGNPGAMGIKKPYLIITRPQTNMAIDYERYDGKGSNYTARVGDCSGYIKCKEVHLNVPGAYADELIEIEQLLKNGILV